MIIDNLKKLKYATNKDLNEQLKRENNMPLLVVLDICETLKSNDKKTKFILNNFQNDKFYILTNYFFTDINKINEKIKLIEFGKKCDEYDSKLLDELVLYFIKFSANPKIDNDEAQNFLRGFIFFNINKLLIEYKESEEHGIE